MDAFKKQEALKPYFDKAFGFAVFETVAKVGFGLGGAAGKGFVYVNKKGAGQDEPQELMLLGEATLIQLSIGLQFGGQVFSEIIFFETQRDLDTFTAGKNYEFEADMTVVALTASASAKITSMGNQGLTAGWGITAAETPQIQEAHDICEYVKGMKVYTLARAGLMYQAAIAGQKFTYKPAAAAGSTPTAEEAVKEGNPEPDIVIVDKN